MRTDILERKKEILEWIKLNKSKAFICRELKCKFDTFTTYMKKMNIEYKGNQGCKGIKQGIGYKPASIYLGEGMDVPLITSHKLRIKLIKDGVKEHKCEVCNLSEWNRKLIPIELDHINGNHYDNRLENLRIICPNCHAQTKTHVGKNKQSYRNKMGD